MSVLYVLEKIKKNGMFQTPEVILKNIHSTECIPSSIVHNQFHNILIIHN